MPYPTFNSVQMFAPDAQREIQQFMAYLTAWQRAEHHDDGSHGALTCDSLKERGRSTAAGVWITPAFVASIFTASSGTWGVDSSDRVTFAYMLVGLTLTVSFEIFTTDVSATPSELLITIPGGFTAAKQMRNLCEIVDAGAASVAGHVYVTAGGTSLHIGKLSGNFTATSGDDTSVFGQISFEVRP